MSRRRAISQREARRLAKRVVELERQIEAEHRSYARDYPGGVNIATSQMSDVTTAMLKTAQLLRHPIVAVVSQAQTLFYALPEVDD